MVSHFERKQKRNILKNKLFVASVGIFLPIILALIIFADIKIYKNKQKLSFQLENLQKQIEEIKKRNEEFEEGIAKSDDKDYIEKIAREEFGMQQPGEKVVAFLAPEKKENQQEPNDNDFWSRNFFLKWLNNIWQSVLSK